MPFLPALLVFLLAVHIVDDYAGTLRRDGQLLAAQPTKEFVEVSQMAALTTFLCSDEVLPCRFRGEEVNFVVRMYLDDDPPISAGREI